MKKLFSIFCCLLLSASMVTQAQLRETVNKSPNGDILHKANLASGRNNAPTAIQGAWDYESSSAFNQTFSSCSVAKSDHYSYDNLYILSAEITNTYWLYLGFNVTLSNGKIPAGTYTVTKFSNYGYCEDDGGSNYYMWITYPANTCAKSQGIRGSGSGWRITPSYIESNSNTWCIQSGSVTINHVNNGCGYYVTTSSLKNYNGKSVSFTIGRDDYTYTITAVSSDNSLGSVSGGGSKKEGSNATLTANAAAGCSFVRWHDGNTDNPRTINVTGNATYTAYFVSNTAAQYTISTAVSPAAAGTVTGAGSYFENNPATLTATSANEHLYIFDHWLKDGNNYAGGTTITPTVTADATYTAVFRNAAAGTITGVADHGTISGTGNYAGGTAVQLGVTAADGYVFTQWTDGNTDNPRTVYVDGNATYTAQFVQGVAINVEMGRLGVYDSSDAATMNDGSSGNAWFHIIGRDGEYEVRFESYGKYFSAGKVYGSSDVDQSNSWIKRNGVTIPLNFNDISATATLNRTYGGKYGIYDISMRFVGTDGKIYMVSGQAVRAIYYDTADDYAFPKMDYNFNAPSFMSSIPEDYGPNIYTYTADGDGKWLYLKQSISGVDYYLRLCFKVAGNSIPTGTYQLNATGSGIPVGTAIPTILYDISTTKNQWPNEVNGSNVFIWGDDAYWWFLEYGTINVVNTNGVYYVEVDAINSFAEPVRFTMGTRPVVSYNLAWDANGGELSGTYTAAGSVNEGTSITAPTATKTGYHLTGWSPAFTGTMPASDVTYVAQWELNTYTVTFKVHDNSTGFGTLQKNSETPTTEIVFTGVPHNTAKPSSAGGNALSFQNSTITPIPAEAADGYTYAFQGWNGATSKITSDKTISARFTRTATEYTITYNNYDISTYPGTLTTIYTVETPTITLPFAPNVAKEGYTFGGWYGNEGLTGTPVTSIAQGSTGNKEFWAKWTEQTYNITYRDKNNATYSGNNEGSLVTNHTYGTSTNLVPGTKSGYTFLGWYDNAECTGSAITEIGGTAYTADITLYAAWQEANYTVDVAVEDGQGTVTKSAASVQGGGSVTITYTPDTYTNVNGEEVEGFYRFVRWSDGNTDANRTISSVSDNINLTAVTELKTDLVLRDDMPDTYYDALAEAYYIDEDHPVQLTSLTYKRTFKNKRWADFSLPFYWSLEGTELDGKIRKYDGATGDADSGLDVHFSEAYEIVPGKPYLIYPNEGDIVDFTFIPQAETDNESLYLTDAINDANGDKLSGYEDGTNGTVRFEANNRRFAFPTDESRKQYIFLSNNRLYYPNSAGNTMRPFRGFFHVNGVSAGVTPRVRIVADGQVVTEIEEAVYDETQDVNVKKYIENGVLIIERNGIRYNATGTKIEN